MALVKRALWHIETRLDRRLLLDDVAALTGVSRFHLSRAFSYGTGVGLAAYVRGRKLSLGAERLAAGCDDILSLALALGYSSHEAFSRAFKERFGVTPEVVRRSGETAALDLMEELRMADTSPTASRHGAPRLVQHDAVTLAGLNERYTPESAGAIPGQWQRFAQYLGHIPGQVEGATFGVVHGIEEEDAYQYLCAVAVSGHGELPPALQRHTLPAGRHAVFPHAGHVSEVRSTCAYAFDTWLPQAGLSPVPGVFFERYGERFDPVTGDGGFEVWIPVL